MKRSRRSLLSLLLALVLAAGLPCAPAAAVGSSGVTSVSASYSNGTVTVTGEAGSDVLAVAVLLYSGDTLLRLETAGVTGGTFTAAIAVTLSPGVYTVKAADYEGGEYAATTFTIAALPIDRGGPGGGSPTPTYSADVAGGSGLPVNVNAAADSASVNLETVAGKLSDGGNTVVTLPSIPGVSAYTATLPASSLSVSGTGSLTLDTGAGSVTVPCNMLSGAGLTGDAGITIAAVDRQGLPEDIRTAIGDRPIIQLTLSVDGRQIDWHNPSAPVAVSIPYTPTAAEIGNPESIVIWYIDGSGRAVSVPNGRYDPGTATVTFSTTHFSYYAVGYNPVSFNDVAAGAWYNKAVSFIAARAITDGTGGGNFSPEARLTRGEFIVLMMRAYEVAPDIDPADNFSDAGNTYYTGYLAAAKRLGFSAGVGNNMYAPGKEIARQEMFTLLYNALKAIGRLPQGHSGKTLSDFSDAGQIDSWARDAMTLLVETGAVGGDAGRLAPLSTTTRAEMAQMLYNLLSK